MINLQKVADFFTLCNGISGFIAILHVLSGNVLYGFLFTCYAFAFDFFDGPVARFEKNRKVHELHNFGALYDSLADAISFVLNPAILILMKMETYGTYMFLLFCFAGWFRLCKFTINEYMKTDNKVSDFIGVPTPLSTFLVYLFHWILQFNYSYILIILLCFLMNSKVKIVKPKLKL